MERPWVDNIRAEAPDLASAIELRKPSRIPVILWGTLWSAFFGGVRFSDCMLDLGLYARCMLNMTHHFRPDILMNVYLEKYILEADKEGARLEDRDGVRYLVDVQAGSPTRRIADDGNPQRLVGGELATTRGEFDEHEAWQLQPSSLMETYCLGGEAVLAEIAGGVPEGVLTTTRATNVSNTIVSWRGFENTCVDMRDRPGLTRHLVDVATELSIACARRCVDAGAKAFLSGGSWGSLFGPQQYAEYFHDSQCRIHKAIHDAGGIVLLGVSGTQSHLMDMNVASVPDVMIIDQDDIGEIKRSYGDQVCIAGNLDPDEVLFRGTPQMVRQAAISLIDQVGPAGYVFSTADVLMPGVPTENVQAMFDAARSYL